MFKGIHLTLMVGGVLKVAPVPPEIVEALTSVEVTTAGGEASGFQLTFSLDHRSPLHTLFLLSGASPVPLVRLVIAVTVNGATEVLMDGVMTHHQVTPGTGPGQSTLTVTGRDLTAVMDLVDFSGGPYAAMSPEMRVAVILARYQVLGIVPQVLPSVLLDVPIPLESIPVHRGTDLEYLRWLAEEVGYVFYLEPGPRPGASTAYWGPQIRLGPAQPALTINMDAHTNVTSLNFSFDTESRMTPLVFVQNPITKTPVPIPTSDINPLSPPLGLVPPLSLRIGFESETAKLGPVRAALVAFARGAQSAQALSASGSLDVLRYGRVLKARQLVGVRGAGLAFNGLYYVDSVTHSLKRGAYTQSFKLSRNGLISTRARVPV
jgi:hypothetical protein